MSGTITKSDHFHVFDVGGVQMRSSGSEADPLGMGTHTHTVTLPHGVVMRTSADPSIPGHVHSLDLGDQVIPSGEALLFEPSPIGEAPRPSEMQGDAPQEAYKQDPWAIISSEEERLALLQARAVESVTRPSLRQKSEEELAAMHANIAKLFNTHFIGNTAGVSVTGLERADLLAAGALLEEELERRGALGKADDALRYEINYLRKAAVFNESRSGVLVQGQSGVFLQLPGGLPLKLEVHRSEVDVVKASSVWSPYGSRYHTSLFNGPIEVHAEPTAELDQLPLLAKIEFERGADRDGEREYFMSGGMAGVLRVGTSTVEFCKAVVPYVLSEEAVASGWMPRDGHSALPSSVEADTPPHLRFWKTAQGEDPRKVRDALVFSGHLSELRPCDGKIRRFTTKFFIDAYQPVAPHTFAREPDYVAAVQDAMTLAKFDGTATMASAVGEALREGGDPSEIEGDLIVAVDEGAAEDVPADALARVAKAHTGRFLIAYPDKPGAAAEFVSIGFTFRMKSAPATLFVCDRAVMGPMVVEHVEKELPGLEEISVGDLIRWNEKSGLVHGVVRRINGETARIEVFRPAEPAEKGPEFEPTGEFLEGPLDAMQLMVRSFKAVSFKSTLVKAEEERMVYGIVLEPETVDKQNDIYSAEEVRNAAHVFMEKFRNTGLMHESMVNDRVKILESFVAPVEFEAGGQSVKKGTWVMAMRIQDDSLWKAAREGRLTGFSIGGHAIRRPDDHDDSIA